MITLITGIPGSGKTSYVVAELLKLQGRPIFCDGIPELKIPHEPCPPLNEWTVERDDPSSASGKKICFAFPPNAVIVIDEAQRVYRPRSVGSRVPAEVAAFETHRHEGLDFWLITQNPTLIDSNVRKLVGKHIHFRPTWAGRYMHEWNECADVESTNARSVAATTRYKLPKKAFEQYKSAVVHTANKKRIPMVVWIFLVALIGCAFFGWKMYSRFTEINAPKESAKIQKSGDVSHAKQSAPGPSGERLTTAEYLEQYQPRIAGLHHTAPAYDEITKPVDAPIPVGCVESKRTGCKCYDQQGNKYVTTDAICKQILADGIFFAWKKTEPYEPLSRKREEPAQVAAIPAPAAVSSGPWNNSHVRELPGGSHNFTGGFKPEPPKQQDNTFTIKPAG